MQLWHTGDYCTINTSPFPCLLSNCHRTAMVKDATKELCSIPKNEDAELWNSDRKRKGRKGAGLGRYNVGCPKVLVDFSSQNHSLYIL